MPITKEPIPPAEIRSAAAAQLNPGKVEKIRYQRADNWLGTQPNIIAISHCFTMDYIRMPQEEVRICVAEDNYVNRVFCQKLLERFCYTNVVFYNDGRAAVDGIKKHAAGGEPFHIVFMDSSMPVMDGMEATRLLRADLDAAVRDVPIIGVCPSGAGMVERLQELGMQDVILKPVRTTALTEMIEQYGNPLRPVVPEPADASTAAGCEAGQGPYSLQPHL